jgi:predicted nucleic acid-binding protein
MATKPTLYLETTIVSYLVSRPSRDVIVLAHQEVTRSWWGRWRDEFTVYVSPVVLEEAGVGDPTQARQRLEALRTFSVLEASPRVEELAGTYYAKLDFPERAIRDAAHLAFAVAYAVDYLVTWNCAHLANAHVRRRLARLNEGLGVRTPTICTPEELSGPEG